MRVLYLFIDGIGFGSPDPEINPFAKFARSSLRILGDPDYIHSRWKISPLDAHQGYPGLPQSATGQTSLWTGQNGSRAMGHHKTGFPGPTLKKIIAEHSIIKRFQEDGSRATLVNAYSPRYIERIQSQPRFRSASTLVQQASDQPLKNLTDLEQQAAIYMDITHEMMHRFMPEYKSRFPRRSPVQTARILLDILRKHDLVLYEFFLTDKAGHKQDWSHARWCIETLESFLDTLLAGIDPASELLILASDHGNLEDLSTKTHTHNPVPGLFYGQSDAYFANQCHELADVPNTILALKKPEH
ncbi:MAG: alkaline phosphatase family protein [Leptospiraceae bacterium]|nr:alkaline phosphatase family protein [Leptospiraceae bacterium]